ncbi:MAG: hypothetical protein MUC28_00510 [Planctomycetes bacterium]|jgi:hypothetical protein|nr:hypothetical protein [Planctomycetota bacterium]
MDIKNLAQSFKNLPSDQFKRKLNEVVRTNPRFTNLDDKNKKVIADLLSKHKDNIKSYGGISSDTISRESYNLYQNREKMGLSEEDLKDVKEFLGMFKK